MNHLFPQYAGIVRVGRADEYVVAQRRRMHLLGGQSMLLCTPIQVRFSVGSNVDLDPVLTRLPQQGFYGPLSALHPL